MSTYIVTRKSDGVEVYRYNADAPIEWGGMEFATHDHTAIVEGPVVASIVPGEWRLYVGPFFDRFGVWKLQILSSADPMVQAVVKDCSVRQCIDLIGRRTELLQAIGLLKSKGFAVDEVAILDVKPAPEDVYRG